MDKFYEIGCTLHDGLAPFTRPDCENSQLAHRFVVEDCKIEEKPGSLAYATSALASGANAAQFAFAANGIQTSLIEYLNTRLCQGYVYVAPPTLSSTDGNDGGNGSSNTGAIVGGVAGGAAAIAGAGAGIFLLKRKFGSNKVQNNGDGIDADADADDDSSSEDPGNGEDSDPIPFTSTV
jgi:hypothetical protein